jgi:hypothetical protein
MEDEAAVSLDESLSSSTESSLAKRRRGSVDWEPAAEVMAGAADGVGLGESGEDSSSLSGGGGEG